MKTGLSASRLLGDCEMGINWSSEIFISRLNSRKNAHVLGSGCFGTVFSLNSKSDRVLKVSTLESDGWPIYARWCMTRGSIHVNALRVYSIHEINHDTSRIKSFVTSSIERLSSMHTAPDHIHDLAYHVINMFDYAYNPRHKEFTKSWNRVKEFQPDMHSLVIELEALRNEFGCTNDMHHGNMMYRPSTGHIVITDPFGSSSTRGHNVKKQDRTVIGRIRSSSNISMDLNGQYRMKF